MVRQQESYELLVALSRYTAGNTEQEAVMRLVEQREVHWNLFLAATFKEKVAGLAFLNIERWRVPVPPRIYDVMRLFYYANEHRNRALQDALVEILTRAKEVNLDVRPLKGSVLLSAIYVDGGSRFLNDLDLFVLPGYEREINELMSGLGYRQGHVAPSSKSIIPLSREEIITWKLKMFNMPPFVRISDDRALDVVYVDFTHGFSFQQQVDVSTHVISKSSVIGGLRTLHETDFFIHLCCHLHKEATNEAWDHIGQSVNLIKYCDVREFLLAHQSTTFLAELADRISELKTEGPVAFALAGVAEIYGEEDVEFARISLGLDLADREEWSRVYRQGHEVVGSRDLRVSRLIGSI